MTAQFPEFIQSKAAQHLSEKLSLCSSVFTVGKFFLNILAITNSEVAEKLRSLKNIWTTDTIYILAF